MKSAFSLLMLATAVAGCATTAADLREQSPTLTATSQQTPEQLAGCIIRNVERLGGAATSAQMQPGVVPGQFDVVARNTYSSTTTLFVATIAPSPSGASVNVFVRQDLVFRSPKAYAEDQLRGC